MLGEIDLIGADGLEVLEERAYGGARGGDLNSALSFLSEVEAEKE